MSGTNKSWYSWFVTALKKEKQPLNVEQVPVYLHWPMQWFCSPANRHEGKSILLTSLCWLMIGFVSVLDLFPVDLLRCIPCNQHITFAKFKPGELLSRGPKPVRTHLGCAHSNLTPNLIGFLIWENSIEHNISQSNSRACVITLRLQYHNKIIPPQHCVY